MHGNGTVDRVSGFDGRRNGGFGNQVSREENLGVVWRAEGVQSGK
jgi:hypothetical protein